MNQNLVPTILLFATLALSYLYWVGDKAQSVSVPRPSVGRAAIPYDRVQQYAREAEVKMDIHKQRAEVNKIKKRALLNPNFQKDSEFHKPDPNDSLGPAARDLSHDQGFEAFTLDQRMDAFLAQRHRYESLEQAKKELYVQEFIKEAKAMGFRVMVNDDMEIISVEELK